MSYTTQYIGSRYVPMFADPMEWTSTRTYEPLTIVLNEGNSYTSRQFVPVGIDISNDDYWAETGNYNAQVEAYRQEIKQQVQQFKELTPFDINPTQNSAKAVQSNSMYLQCLKSGYIELYKILFPGLNDTDLITRMVNDGCSTIILSSSKTYTFTELPANICITNNIYQSGFEIPQESLQELNLPTITNTNVSILKCITFNGIAFTNCTFNGQKVNFFNCYFYAVTFGNSHIINFSTCRFAYCDNCFAELTDSKITFCEFISCHGTHLFTQLNTSQVNNNRFEWCNCGTIFNLTYAEKAQINSNLFDRCDEIISFKQNTQIQFNDNTVIRSTVAPFSGEIWNSIISGNNFIVGEYSDTETGDLRPPNIFAANSLKNDSSTIENNNFKSTSYVCATRTNNIQQTFYINKNLEFKNNQATITASELFTGNYNTSPEGVFNDIQNISGVIYSNGIYTEPATITTNYYGSHVLSITAIHASTGNYQVRFTITTRNYHS